MKYTIKLILFAVFLLPLMCLVGGTLGILDKPSK